MTHLKMNQAKEHYHWKTLFREISRRTYVLIEQHNLQYPCQHELKKWKKAFPDQSLPNLFSLAYPRRVKESEEKTFVNILKQWCKQVDAQIKNGETTISNRVFTNRKSARNFKRCARGTNQHLAKGVYAGILIGQEEKEVAEYSCQFTSTYGKGLGVRPWKVWHGSNRDFELCIHPKLIPLELLPQGVSLIQIDPYKEQDQKVFEATVWKLFPSKEKKTPLSLEKIETYNKSISQDSIDGNSEAVGRLGFAKKYLDGAIREAYVELLINAYLEKLAAAMKRKFHQRELEQGKQSIRKMLEACSESELDSFVNRCLATIDHMEQWIQLDPEANFVMPPSYWFDLSYPHNIAGAHRKFFQKWQLVKENFKLSQRKNRSFSPTLPNAENLGQSIKQFANQLQRHFHSFHPTDKRVKKARIDNWGKDLSRQMTCDKISFAEMKKVSDWLFKSKSKRAEFWRMECGGFGIRSASGFRRHFGAMRDQMIHEGLMRRHEANI